ncbi:MAG TPA: hypothetical protein DCL61_30215 [Cyanobacteria bacterium UBA12227]|nr:hypothetical protein [Cyanobacteria bacterium UBA12227]HAX86448.1 hypothetical protein [Cyanobacteria bacterium UBA11370]HBY78309.1 hypothetical protein [Cyanobacteria bacterium UBA11148]
MPNKFTHSWKFIERGLPLFLITLLVLGVFFRFANLGKKIYWFDEVYTSLRVAGYTEYELVQTLSTNPEIGGKELQNYQRINPEKTLFNTIHSLALEDAQHPPLYYILARFWVQVWGDSVAIIRSFTALTSLLVFPCLYWLCLELFNSSLMGWVAIALVSVSPFHVALAQEAREYTLWTVTILLSGALVLRAMRLKTRMSWVIYGASIGVGLYTFPLTGLVAIGYGIYVFVIEKFRLSKTVIACLLASVSAILIFIPWIWVIFNSLHRINRTTAWATKSPSPFSLVKSWVGDLSRVFIDFGLHGNSNQASSYFLIPISLILLILVGYSLYFICRNSPKNVWLFIVSLIGVTGLALVLPDLILGGRRSTAGRYLIPCYLGIEIAIAYLFTTQITTISSNKQSQKLWKLVMVVLLSSGILSCAVSSQSESGWTKAINYYNPAVARLINQANHPLVISDAYIGDVLSLNYLLNPNVQFQLNPPCYSCYLDSSSRVQLEGPQNTKSFSDVFLFKPSQVLQDKFEQEYRIESIYEGDILWQIKN